MGRGCTFQPSLFDSVPSATGAESNSPVGCPPPAGDARDDIDTSRKLARSTHPVTSIRAAMDLVESGQLAKNDARALRLVAQYQGMTAAELDRIDGANFPDRNNRRRISKRLAALADDESKRHIKRGRSRVCTANGTQALTWFLIEVEESG